MYSEIRAIGRPQNLEDMKWDVTEIEEQLIEQLAESKSGRCGALVKLVAEDGSELTVGVDGCIDEEDGKVSIRDVEIYAYDAQGEEEDCSDVEIDMDYIEDESTKIICKNVKDADDLYETESALCWGGRFV